MGFTAYLSIRCFDSAKPPKSMQSKTSETVAMVFESTRNLRLSCLVGTNSVSWPGWLSGCGGGPTTSVKSPSYSEKISAFSVLRRTLSTAV
ncbi:hypothetical protein RB213_009179 [Colletotrichum asianum]